MTSKRCSRHVRLAAAVTAAVVLLAACSGSDDDKADTTTTSRETTTEAPAGSTSPSSVPTGAAATKTASTAADLEPLLIKAVPSGFVPQPDDVGDTGPSDLAKAVRDDGSDDARAFLQSHGFIAGYQRLWVSGLKNDANGNPDLDNAEQIIVFLYAFRDNAGAAAYMARTLEGANEGPQELTRYEPSGIPGAVGFSGGNATDGYGGVILFTKGGFLVQINLVRHSPDGNRELADGLARDQFSRL